MNTSKIKPLMVFGRPSPDGAHIRYEGENRTGQVLVFGKIIGYARDNAQALKVYFAWLKQQIEKPIQKNPYFPKAGNRYR